MCRIGHDTDPLFDTELAFSHITSEYAESLAIHPHISRHVSRQGQCAKVTHRAMKVLSRPQFVKSLLIDRESR
jgi:hypothetical protein